MMNEFINQSLLFAFCGQGGNWEGMCKEMMDREPLFYHHICQIDKLLKNNGEKWSLVNEIRNSENKRVMGNIVGQPATFAIQYATVKLLESWGIKPSAVIGMSLGEVAAVCCSGALNLKEALQIIQIRSRCQENCSPGSMAILRMLAEQAQNMITDLGLESSVCVAGINDNCSVVISGDKDSIEAIENHVKLHYPNMFWKLFKTCRAFHSMHMEPIKNSFYNAMESFKLKPNLLKVPMYSSALGQSVTAEQLGEVDYWWQNMRGCVLFYKAISRAIEDGHAVIMEISPQPILKVYLDNIVAQTRNTVNKPTFYLTTFPHRSVHDQHKEFFKNTFCRLYKMGYPLDWSVIDANGSPKCLQ